MNVHFQYVPFAVLHLADPHSPDLKLGLRGVTVVYPSGDFGVAAHGGMLSYSFVLSEYYLIGVVMNSIGNCINSSGNLSKSGKRCECGTF